MGEVLPLTTLARLVTIQALLYLRDFPQNTAAYIWALLRTEHYSAVTEAILKQMVDQFPSKLNGDLLQVLTPPHVRELNIRKCWGVSVASMAEILTK